jgi:LysM repeat protein
MKKSILPLLLGLSLTNTVQAAEIEFKNKNTVVPNIGYVTTYETYRIKVEQGDTLLGIVRKLNQQELGHNYTCGDQFPATVEDLLKWNQFITDKNKIKAGQELTYTRIAHQFSGFQLYL